MVRARRLSGLFVTVILAFLAHPGGARADGAGAGARHFQRGQAAMSEGDPTVAVSEFLAAWRAEPSARTLLAVAMAYEAAGDRASARAYYWWYLNSGAAQPPEQEWLFPKIVALSGAAPVNPPKPKAEPPAQRKAPPPPEPPAESPPPRPVRPPPASTKQPTPPPASTKQPTSRPPPPPKPATDDEDPLARLPVVRPEPAAPPRPSAPPPEPATPPAETGPTHARWYGLPMLLLEPVAFAAILGGADSDKAGVVTVGVLGVVFISPFVHGYYGHGARGWGGFFLRAGGTLVGVAAGGSTGAAVGYAAAFLTDAFVLARDDAPDQPSVVPVVDVGEGHASFGLAGTF